MLCQEILVEKKKISWRNFTMTKHYEDVWLEAEKVSAELIKSDEMLEVAHDIESCASELAEELSLDNDAEKITILVGEILFKTSRICKEYNINSWEVIEDSINNAKIDLYEDDED